MNSSQSHIVSCSLFAERRPTGCWFCQHWSADEVSGRWHWWTGIREESWLGTYYDKHGLGVPCDQSNVKVGMFE